MTSIVSAATVCLTEQSLKELVTAVQEAREIHGEGEVLVVSSHSPVRFVIEMEKSPNIQKSIGYKLFFMKGTE